jgi:LexA-binding, inner membrane-associated putative hydrolase
VTGIIGAVMRATHHLLGLSAGLGLAAASEWPWPQAAAAAFLAGITAAGPTSPDVDQYKAWRRLDRWIPDELLGAGGPLQHRGLSHWWGLPAAAALTITLLPGPMQWMGWCLVVGWVSHLFGDLAFGRADPWSGRGPGIPVWPWWGHMGVGLDTGGWLEGFTAAIVLPAALAWQSWDAVAPVVAALVASH